MVLELSILDETSVGVVGSPGDWLGTLAGSPEAQAPITLTVVGGRCEFKCALQGGTTLPSLPQSETLFGMWSGLDRTAVAWRGCQIDCPYTTMVLVQSQSYSVPVAQAPITFIVVGGRCESEGATTDGSKQSSHPLLILMVSKSALSPVPPSVGSGGLPGLARQRRAQIPTSGARAIAGVISCLSCQGGAACAPGFLLGTSAGSPIA